MEAKFDNLDIFFLKYIHPFEPNEGVKLHNLEWGVGFSTINKYPNKLRRYWWQNDLTYALCILME